MLGKRFKIFINSILLVAIFATLAFAQEKPPKPTPDSSITVVLNSQENDRVKRVCVKAVKILLKAKLRAEKRKIFNRDNDLIEKLEVAVEADELIEVLLDKKIAEFKAQTRASEFGDGALLEKFLEFLGSDDFANFVEQLSKLLELIFKLIGTVAIDSPALKIQPAFIGRSEFFSLNV